MTREISAEAKDVMDRAQRENLLREKIASAKKLMQVEQEALKELGRLERMPEVVLEHSMVATRLYGLAEPPWNVATDERIDLTKARVVLAADDHGLEKVKKRVLAYLAVPKLNPHGKSPHLGLGRSAGCRQDQAAPLFYQVGAALYQNPPQ